MKIDKCRLWLLYVLPVVLFCSYFPVIYLGTTNYMYLEIFLPLVWLVVFDGISLVQLANKKVRKNYQAHWTKNVWLLFAFPLLATISILWTKDVLRGILTSGIIWAIVIAIVAIRQLLMSLKKAEQKVVIKRLLKIFLAAAVAASAICWVQAFLDVWGVSRKITLICAGCTYHIIGFPHPSGLAVEPQYMGNLLLAPLLLVIYMKLTGKSIYSNKKTLALMTFFGATLFLTLSRGAILSFGAACAVMLIVFLCKKAWKKVGAVVGVLVAALMMTLCVQGTMAALAPTADTFWSGVTKSIHQVSLGKIDLRNWAAEKKEEDKTSATDESTKELETVHFDGYIEESTNSRLMMNGFVWEIMGQDVKTMLFGVGIGGAVRSVDEFKNMRDVIPNVYLTILLETGICGALLLAICAGMLLWKLAKMKSTWKTFLLILLLSYGLSINFFSGVTNVIHIYLLPFVVYIFISLYERN